MKLVDYVKWLLSFIDDGKLIPTGEELFVSFSSDSMTQYMAFHVCNYGGGGYGCCGGGGR